MQKPLRGIAISILFALLPITSWGEPGLQNNDLVAICGDSITQQKLYSLYIEDYLVMCQPRTGLQAVQFGWGGETTWDFLTRQANDCLVFRPTVATICYGMNDANYGPTNPKKLEYFKKSTAKVIQNFKAAGVRFIVLGGPGAVDSGTYRKCSPAIYNATLADFSKGAQEVAAEEGVAFANVHEIMMQAMEKAKARYGADYVFAGGDGIHPGPNGHLVMAYAFLKALGCTGEIGTITVDLESKKATATEGHRILSNSNGVLEVESSRYPFCFTGDPSGQTTRSSASFIPFNADLNRFLLIVKQAPAKKLKITWGPDSKIFGTDDLEKGINLTEEFPNTPFNEPFAKVETAISGQQEFETPATKVLLHSLMEWRKIFPAQDPTVENLQQTVLDRDKALRNAAAAAVVPVKHTIKIESAE